MLKISIHLLNHKNNNNPIGIFLNNMFQTFLAQIFLDSQNCHLPHK